VSDMCQVVRALDGLPSGTGLEVGPLFLLVHTRGRDSRPGRIVIILIPIECFLLGGAC